MSRWLSPLLFTVAFGVGILGVLWAIHTEGGSYGAGFVIGFALFIARWSGQVAG